VLKSLFVLAAAAAAHRSRRLSLHLPFTTTHNPPTFCSNGGTKTTMDFIFYLVK
jgi:hypothetical protein